MNDFLFKWFLSLIVGATWATLSSVIAEKVSGKLGGLIVGLPSTAAISLLFVGLTQGVEAVQEASLIVPLSSGLYVFFFITYLLASKKGFLFGFFKSLAVWFIFAFVASKIKVPNLYISILVWISLVSTAIYWVVKNIEIDEKQIPTKISGSPIWIKAILSGAVISFIVLIGKLAGPTWSGIFATFPALTISTFLITIKSGGVEFTRLIAKNVLISTTTTVGLYGILMYFIAPYFGVIGGFFISYVVLLLITIPIYNLVLSKFTE